MGFEEYICGEGVFRSVAMTLADWGKNDSMSIMEVCKKIWGRSMCGGRRYDAVCGRFRGGFQLLGFRCLGCIQVVDEDDLRICGEGFYQMSVWMLLKARREIKHTLFDRLKAHQLVVIWKVL